MTSKTKDTPRWRDKLAIHPACARQPETEDIALKGLAYDIFQHGQQEPIKLWQDPGDGVTYLIDGRSRLDALELLGVQTVTTRGKLTHVEFELVEGDPEVIVTSLNVHRRHLKSAQKRKAIREQLMREPELSDRRTGELLGVDHKTVGRIREELVKDGEFPQSSRSRGKTGANKQQSSNGNAGTPPDKLPDYVRDLHAEGDDVRTIDRKVWDEHHVRLTASGVRAVLLPAGIVEPVSSLVEMVGDQRAVELVKGLLVPVGDANSKAD